MKFAGKNLTAFIALIVLCGFNSSNVFAKKHHHSHHIANRNVEQRMPTYSINGQQNLTEEINHIIYSNPNLNIGVHIKSMQYGDTLFTKNEQHSFVPASIIKIFTAESALLLLGPNYQFPTSFVTDAKNTSNGVVHGNLYLILAGDPSLTYYDLEDLVASLKAQHIQQVDGNIYLDSTAYDQEIYGPGWVWNDKRFCYAAPISASIINHNCLSFHVKRITNAAPSCRVRLGSGKNNELVLNDCLPKGHYTQGVSPVITDIAYYNKVLVTRLFNRYGIQVNGSITTGSAPDAVTPLAIHQSKPLRDLITQMLKKSDNIIAGSIFKKIGEVYTKQPGSWQNGSDAVTHILSKQVGVDTWRINITDGSGLSRYNLVTPSQMMRVLDFAFHHHGTNYEFISALPVAGVDGTLKHRLRNVAWKVRAKTGTMSGVVALAGYAISRNKEPLAFVLIVNGHTGMGWKYRSLEDQIVTALTRYARA